MNIVALGKWRHNVAHLLMCLYVLLGANVYAAEDEPPGRMVNVGTHNMHIHCIGQGQPTVVFDAGLGGSMLDWSRVQPLVADYTTVCAYDRSGYGWSETSKTPRSSRHIAEELHTLLKEADVAPHYLLVGHSFGGFNTRVFASLYRDEVAGLVLIDASHESQFEQFERQFGVSLAPKRAGHLRLSPPRIPRGIPERLREIAMRRAIRASSMLTVRDELMNFRRSALEVKQHMDLPDVPLIVMTRGERQWRGRAQSDAMEALWLKLQHSLTELATDREHIIAARAGHYVHLDQPELVSSTIHEMVRRVRGGTVSWEMLAAYGARMY